MNVLFYGGCHAQVLHRIFSECFTSEISSELLINYKLIAELDGFPYEKLEGVDVVVYSPIVSKEHWNTIHLEKFCRENNIKTISYPWLEWHGYFPECSKGSFLGGRTWIYKKLEVLAKSIRTFDSFIRAVLDVETIAHENLEKTTGKLKHQEESCKLDVVVTDFIMKNYQEKRLFLLPDHPTKVLYEYVATAIADRLGLTFSSEFFQSMAEPQAGDEIPILPIVKKELGLRFEGERFANKEILKTAKIFSFTEYAEIFFFANKDFKFFSSTRPTFIKQELAYSADISSNRKMEVGTGTLIMASHVELHSDGHFILTNRQRSEEEVVSPFYIYSEHWSELLT